MHHPSAGHLPHFSLPDRAIHLTERYCPDDLAQVWKEVDGKVEGALPGPLKGVYTKVTGMVSNMQSPQ